MPLRTGYGVCETGEGLFAWCQTSCGSCRDGVRRRSGSVGRSRSHQMARSPSGDRSRSHRRSRSRSFSSSLSPSVSRSRANKACSGDQQSRSPSRDRFVIQPFRATKSGFFPPASYVCPVQFAGRVSLTEFPSFAHGVYMSQPMISACLLKWEAHVRNLSLKVA